MSLGNFNPEETKVITNMKGEKVPVITPAGYVGVFWGRVYNSNGKLVHTASDYFMNLAESNGLEEFQYCDIINDAIDQYCMDNIDPLIGDNPNHRYQCGFGGDECDGMIDFFLPVKVPQLPDLKFSIKNQEYTVKWKYSN